MFSRCLALFAVIILFTFPRVGFGERDFGLGILMGQPSGLRTAFSIQKSLHIDCAAAWSWDDWLLVFADCQFEDYISPWSLNWRWYYGLGAYAGIPETRQGIFGLRIPLGVSYQVPYTSLEVFGEVVPALRLVPDTQAQLQGGVGFLVWF